MTDIHPSAIVAQNATIGRGVRIGPFCQVGPDVILEDGVTLVSHAVVDGCTRIGAQAVIWPFATVGLPPQDLKYRGEPTRTEIGPRTQVREHCTIHRGTVTGAGITRIGADCLLMSVVHVAHDCVIGDRVILATNVAMGGHVEIADHAVVGGSAALHQFVRIGRGAMVGGLSGVEADVIPFGSVVGNRARLAGLNIVGLRRRGHGREELHRLRTAFRMLFGAEGVFAERLEVVRREYGDETLVAELLDFIDAPSRRGLIRAAVIEDDAA